MTKKELKKLRSQMPRGYGKILSERTGKHFNAIYRALNGESKSPEIINAAIDLAFEESKRKKQIQEKIRNL